MRLKLINGGCMSEGTRRVMLKVDDDLCQICDICEAGAVCRGNAFRRFERDDSPFLDMSRCWGCLLCVPACPFDAVVMHNYED